MAKASRRADRPGRSGLSFALIVIALVVALYLILQFLGFIFKLLFFAALVLVAAAAVRAWRRSS